jgi:hypothetical protein
VLAHAFFINLRHDEILYRIGERSEEVFFVLEGSLLYTDDDGQILYIEEEGGIIG